MAKKEDKADNPQSKTGEGLADQPQAGTKQPTPSGAANNADPAAKTQTKKSEPKVSDAVQKIGKSLLKNNPDMSVVYMTADGRGFYEKNDADNHARTLNNKAVTPVKR